MRKRLACAAVVLATIAHPALAAGASDGAGDGNSPRVEVPLEAYALRNDSREAIYIPVPEGACRTRLENAPDTGAPVIVIVFC